MKSPRIYLHHIFKTGGSSLWRDLIEASNLNTNLPTGHIIATDVYNLVISSLGDEWGDTIATDQNSFCNAEKLQCYRRNELELQTYSDDHRLLIHLHHPRRFNHDLPAHNARHAFSYLGEYLKTFISSCKAQHKTPATHDITYVFSLRESSSRFKSHLMQIYDNREYYCSRLANIHNFCVLSKRKLQSIEEALINSNIEAYFRAVAESGIAERIATYQLRTIIAALIAEDKKGCDFIMSRAGNGYINRKVRSIFFNSKVERQPPSSPRIGFSFLDKDGYFITSPNFRLGLMGFGISKFTLNSRYPGTITSHSLNHKEIDFSCLENPRLTSSHRLENYFLRQFVMNM